MHRKCRSDENSSIEFVSIFFKYFLIYSNAYIKAKQI
jgi:hypothetical protein